MQFLTFFAVLLTASQLHAADCPGASHLVLVDRTTAYDETDLAQIGPAVEAFERSVSEGDRVTIATVAESAEASEPLFDGCVPSQGNGVWDIVANPFSRASERQQPFLAFVAAYREAIDSVVAIDPAHEDLPRTALVAAISRHAGNADTVWLLSDLLESAEFPTHALLAGKAPAVPLQLKPGATVHAAGYGRNHDRKRRELSEAEREALLGWWTVAVETAGARMEK